MISTGDDKRIFVKCFLTVLKLQICLAESQTIFFYIWTFVQFRFLRQWKYETMHCLSSCEVHLSFWSERFSRSNPGRPTSHPVRQLMAPCWFVVWYVQLQLIDIHDLILWGNLWFVIWMFGGLGVIWVMQQLSSILFKTFLLYPWTHSTIADHCETTIHKYISRCISFVILKVLKVFSFRIDTLPTFVGCLTFSVHGDLKLRKSITVTGKLNKNQH